MKRSAIQHDELNSASLTHSLTPSLNLILHEPLTSTKQGVSRSRGCVLVKQQHQYKTYPNQYNGGENLPLLAPNPRRWAP